MPPLHSISSRHHSAGPSGANRSNETKPLVKKQSGQQSGQSSSNSSGTNLSSRVQHPTISSPPYSATGVSCELLGEATNSRGCTTETQPSKRVTKTKIRQADSASCGSHAPRRRGLRAPQPEKDEGQLLSRKKPHDKTEVEIGKSVRPPRLETHKICPSEKSRFSNEQCNPSLTHRPKARLGPGTATLSQNFGDRSGPEDDQNVVASGSSGRPQILESLLTEAQSIGEFKAPNLPELSIEPGRQIIRLGIETEFEIIGRNDNKPTSVHPTLPDVVAHLALQYNQEASNKHPRMNSRIPIERKLDTYEEWFIVEDHSVKQVREKPYGIELVSPILTASPGSRWRDDVKVMWKCLTKYYRVQPSVLCGTHIHLSLAPALSLRQLKRIAQAVIHFEPAFEVLMPAERRENYHAKSNWLDCPGLALSSRSRLESMLAIDEIDEHDDSPVALLNLFSDRRYSWNFVSLLTHGTIEFRKPPRSNTAEECLCWAELGLSFVQACVGYKSIDHLRKVPQNVGGLRWFLSQFHQAGVNEPRRLEKLWRDKNPKAMMQPVPSSFILAAVKSRRKKQRLEELIAEDSALIRRLASTAREPYW